MSFKILVVGDFSGKARGAGKIGSAVPVDLDNLDDVLAAIAPAVEIGEKRLIFRSIEDFHPDHLYSVSPAPRPQQPTPAPAAKRPAPQHRASVNLLDDIVQENEAADAPVTVEDAGDLNAFLRRATAGQIAEPEDPRKAEMEYAAGEKIRAILHDPEFQSIESAWRSLQFMLRGVDKSTHTYLLDATLPEFVKIMPELEGTLKKRGPWNLIVGNFYFGQSERDAAVLERAGTFARNLGATFLSGAILPEDAGGDSWGTLRHSSVARHIGLVLPRFLLRLPYGRDTSSVERFPFEEMPNIEHSQYLWGNGAFAAAFLIGSAYDDEDRDWKRRIQRRIDGIPLHVYREGTEHLSTPCAEVLMTEQQAETLLDLGLMPLASLKDQDGVVLVQFRSIADPPATVSVLM